MLTREAVAAALALAGIRSGAHVLDLAPDAGLTRAARAMAGTGGRVDEMDSGTSGPRVRYAYALGIWPDRPAASVVGHASAVLPSLTPSARVILGSAGSLVALADALRAGGWAVLHGTTVADADPTCGHGAELALAAARRP